MSDMEINKVLAQMRSLASNIEKPPATEKPAGPGFGEVLNDSITKVSEVQREARSMATAWEQGKSDAELADVMIAMQKSSLSFQAMMEVRNKLVEAYREIMNMSI